MKGTTANTINVSLILLTNISTKPPRKIKLFRRAKEKEDPITVCKSVVSVVILL